jgi:hypothetical protein
MHRHIVYTNPPKELHQKYIAEYGKKAAHGFPELTFTAKEFHGNKQLAREAEMAGQLKRWVGEDGHDWLGYLCTEVGKIEGACCKWDAIQLPCMYY